MLGACSPKPPSGKSAIASARIATVKYGELPPELTPFAAAIDRSRLDYVDITVHKANALAPWSSKLGGGAYLPKGQPYPAGPDGKPLALLAQLNFSEMPALAGYPSRGILQFFIAGSQSAEHIYGMSNYDAKPFNEQHFFDSLSQQRWFKVVYHANVLQVRDKLQETPAVSADMMLPIAGAAALSFAAASEPVSTFDYRFERFLGKPCEEFFAQFGEKEVAIATNYIAFSDKRSAAKVGGYSSPVQRDPRLFQPNEDWVVLLELQSASLDDGFLLEWGDGGMGVFYIRRGDLERMDFSKVLYYWDNH